MSKHVKNLENQAAAMRRTDNRYWHKSADIVSAAADALETLERQLRVARKLAREELVASRKAAQKNGDWRWNTSVKWILDELLSRRRAGTKRRKG